MSRNKSSGSSTSDQQVTVNRNYITPGIGSAKNSANIPTMEQVPGTQSTSGGGSSSKPVK